MRTTLERTRQLKLRDLADTEVARRLYAKRNREGLSLAEASGQIGITLPTLHRLETKPGRPSLDVALAVAKWLKMEPALLFPSVK